MSVPTPQGLAPDVPLVDAVDGVRRLLAAHVPLSLLLDLADPAGPGSRDLFASESACTDWLSRPQGRAA